MSGTSRIRVCQLITELRPAGAEKVVYELATRLDRSRFDVRVAALRGGDVARQLQQAGVPVTLLGICGRLNVPGNCYRMGKFGGMLRRERIDILHTHLFHADLVGRIAAGIGGVPHVVHTVHVVERRWRPWQFAFTRLMAGRCDRIIAVSAAARDHHAAKSHLPHSRYAVIPNGIDALAYARDETSRHRTRAAWQVNDSQIVALYLGRLHRDKGIDVLLQAAKELKDSRLRIIIAGDGPMRAQVEQFVHSRDGMLSRCVGFVDDARDALSAADIFVMPSRGEGFGLAMAEAMAAGLPCVGTDVTGVRDLIEDGCSGLLVPTEDPQALAAAIVRLAGDADLRTRFGQEAMRHVREDYSIERMIAAHESLYEQLAGYSQGLQE